MENIIVALIAGLSSVTGTAIAVKKQSQKDQIEAAKREQRQNDRIDVLEKKIDEHNKWGKKFGSCDKNIALMRKDYNVLKQDVTTFKIDLKTLNKEVIYVKEAISKYHQKNN